MIPINYLAVLAATASAIVLGFLWYGPIFGKPWMKIMNISAADMEKAKAKGMTQNYIIMMLGTLLMAYVLSHVIGLSFAYFKNPPMATGLMTGFWVWLGFFAPLQSDEAIWGGKPWKLFFINTSYRLVSLLIMGLILAMWR